MSEQFTMTSPVGPIEVFIENGRVTTIQLHSNKSAKLIEPSTAIGLGVARQLQEYFDGQRTSFEMDLNPHGSEFDKSVWQVLAKIPYGATLSYSDVAGELQRPRAARAVGGACGRNPLLFVVPCHRVLAKNQGLGGFTGGLDIKRRLLQMEGVLG